MTIASQTSRIAYTGDGSTTAFAVPYYFAANADLVVVLQDTSGNQTTQILGTNYSLSGVGISSGGTCTFTTAPTTGYLVTIYRDPSITQTTSYNNNDPFPAKSHEAALDKLTTIDQRLRDQISRTIHQTEGEGLLVTALAPIAARKGKLLGFGSDGSLVYLTGPTYVNATATGAAIVDSRGTAQVTTFGGGVNVVVTGGYTAVGDGGGAVYKRGAGSGSFTDGGAVTWSLDLSGNIVNPLAFGAKGDGTTNDTTAIQAAVTAASGKRLDGLGHAYKITATITGIDNVEIVNAQFIQSGQSAYPLFSFTGNNGWQFRRVRFTGDGDATLNTASTWFGAINFNNSGSTDFSGIGIEDCIFENFSPNYVINGSITGSGGIKNFCFRRNKVYSKVVTYLDMTRILLSLYATGSSANAGGRWYDADVSDNYVDADGLTMGFTFWSGHTRTRFCNNHILNPGVHSLYNPVVGSHNCYGAIFYDAVGAPGNTDTCAVDCEVAGNTIVNPPSAGIYTATARRLNIHDNIITGQFRTDNATLPRGAIVGNDLRDSTIHHNRLEDGWLGINIVGIVGSEAMDVFANVIKGNGATDEIGIRVSAPVSTTTTSKISIRHNDITLTGATSQAILMLAASTAKHGPTAIVDNFLSGPNVGLFAASNYFNGDLVVKGNRYRGTFGLAAIDLHGVTATGVIIEDETFESATTTGFGVYVDGTTNLAINKLTFLGKAASSVCVQAAGGAQGCIDGVQYRGVTASLRVSAGSLGYALPTFTATAGDFIQNLNIDGSEAGSVSAKYISRGWYFQTGTTWVVARQYTGN